MKGDPMLDVGHATGTGRLPHWPAAAAGLILLIGVVAIGLALRDPASGGTQATQESDTSGAVEAIKEVPDSRSDTTDAPNLAAPIQFAARDGSSLQIPTGVPTVMYFMSSTGCVPCEIGAGKLQEVGATHPSLDVIALEMIPGTPPEWMAEYQRILGLEYPVVQDPNGAVALRYGVVNLSVAIVIDAAGNTTAGPFDPADDSALAEALTTIGLSTIGVPSADVSSSDRKPPELLP